MRWPGDGFRRIARSDHLRSFGAAWPEGTVTPVTFENREVAAAGGACNVWNTIESGDYSITEFLSENNINKYSRLGAYASQV